MEFGITFKGFMDHHRARKLVKQAEDAGFTYCWFYDSHILWRESFPALAMCIEHTEKMRFGPCVTNPNTRDWSAAASLFGSLQIQSQGRFDIGVGRGDSAVRVMGKKPAPLGRLEEFVDVVRKLVAGEEAQYGDAPKPIQFPWTERHALPVWVAAYGPKALGTAGRVGDGLILQIAEPSICKWLADQAISAGKEAGRDMSNYRIMSAAPAYFGDMKQCRDVCRWFPAMVGNHVADIVEKYGTDRDDIPASLTAYIKDRKGYDYSKHGQSDNPYLEFITDDIIDGFCVLGTPADHIAKLETLQASGITQFNVYLDNGDEENIIAEYGNSIIPKFQ